MRKRVLVLFTILLFTVTMFGANALTLQKDSINADRVSACFEEDNPNYAFTNGNADLAPAYETEDLVTANAPGLLEKIGELFFKPKKSGGKQEKVYVGGTPIGISLDGNGVIIVGISDIVTENGLVCPAVKAGIHIGDRIVLLGGTPIRNIAQMTEIAASSQGKTLELVYIRDKDTFTTSITPELDIVSNTYKLGVWAKDGSSGVGTLTFLRQDMRYACLGHPIVNAEDGSIYEINGGSVYNCEIIGVNKGVKGAAGQLKGTFSASDRIGSVEKNTKYGVYGTIAKTPYNLEQKLMEVASKDKVKMGAAQIVTTIDGVKPKLYDIEIVKVVNQTVKNDKGMVIRIVDKELIEKTGGIVQGMSGSPIIQDGKLVGAVTHVFVNDPTKGYGLFAEWMLTE